MNKNLLILSILLFLASWARGQALIGTSGGFIPSSGSGINVEYAVGESAILTISAISPGGPGMQGLLQPILGSPYVITVGTEDPFEVKFGFKSFPNPSNDAIIIETSFNDFESVRIIDLNGRTFKVGQFQYSPIMLQDLPPGKYVIQLISKDKTIIKSLKIIKQ